MSAEAASGGPGVNCGWLARKREVGASPNSAERERVRPARQGGAGHGAGLQVGVGGGDRASERGGACAREGVPACLGLSGLPERWAPAKDGLER